MTSTLFDRVCDLENLHAAAWEVLRGKRQRVAACDFFVGLERELLRLRRELRSGGYRPGRYRTFVIREPKRRLISAAPIRDRVVHHAVVRVIEPLFERRFIHHSYACRAGRGTHRCLRQFVRWARTHDYVLSMDLARFFPSIDHEVLKGELRRVVREPALLQLLDAIIDGSNPQEPMVRYFPGDDLFEPMSRRRGLPIGNLTSQFFANVFLDRIDHHIKDRLRIKRYLRYVDDLAIFHRDLGYLRAVRAEVRQALLGLRLRLNEGKSRVRRVSEGVRFLGFVVRQDSLRIHSDAIRRHRRRMKRLRGEFRRGDLAWDDVKASLGAWSAHAAHGDTWRLRGQIFAASPFLPPAQAPLEADGAAWPSPEDLSEMRFSVEAKP